MWLERGELTMQGLLPSAASSPWADGSSSHGWDTATVRRNRRYRLGGTSAQTLDWKGGKRRERDGTDPFMGDPSPWSASFDGMKQ